MSLTRLAYDQSAATKFESTMVYLCVYREFKRRFGTSPCWVMDVGCGPGHLGEVALATGSDYYLGLDLEVEEHRNSALRGEVWETVPWDVAAKGLVYEEHDLVLCLEVAEHLPRDSGPKLARDLSEATTCMLAFSAATPGQGGAGHTNERPHCYWQELFEAEGMKLLEGATKRLREDTLRVAPDAWWYGQNIMLWSPR